mmetsp:Transcript_6972/g.23152  ORF Transcript_6972/g.23152 Transcript_6972/m.23152 type:complete len:508 (+) Transcript_6972:1023-2546(+)
MIFKVVVKSDGAAEPDVPKDVLRRVHLLHLFRALLRARIDCAAVDAALEHELVRVAASEARHDARERSAGAAGADAAPERQLVGGVGVVGKAAALDEHESLEQRSLERTRARVPTPLSDVCNDVAAEVLDCRECHPVIPGRRVAQQERSVPERRLRQIRCSAARHSVERSRRAVVLVVGLMRGRVGVERHDIHPRLAHELRPVPQPRAAVDPLWRRFGHELDRSVGGHSVGIERAPEGEGLAVRGDDGRNGWSGRELARGWRAPAPRLLLFRPRRSRRLKLPLRSDARHQPSPFAGAGEKDDEERVAVAVCRRFAVLRPERPPEAARPRVERALSLLRRGVRVGKGAEEVLRLWGHCDVADASRVVRDGVQGAVERDAHPHRLRTTQLVQRRSPHHQPAKRVVSARTQYSPRCSQASALAGPLPAEQRVESVGERVPDRLVEPPLGEGWRARRAPPPLPPARALSQRRRRPHHRLRHQPHVAEHARSQPRQGQRLRNVRVRAARARE